MITREMVYIDEEKCDGCGECIPHCAEGALQIVNGKAKLIGDAYCDGLGACLGHCPQDAITIEKRQAVPFDEELVKQHLSRTEEVSIPESRYSACPSTRLMTLDRFSNTVTRSDGIPDENPSTLSQWPVQLHLVPPSAPFLKKADLLIAADCVPFAYAGFHQTLLRGKALLIGCPKLDDTEIYLARLIEIFRMNAPRSITIAHMEVPCCFGLVRLVQEAIYQADISVPLEDITVQVDGTLIH